MKYLKKYKLFESLVDKKIELLEDLALELKDAGLQVEIINGSHLHLLRDPRLHIHTNSRYADDYKKFIIMRVTDDNEKFNADLYYTNTIREFIETLKSYGMKPRSMSGGNHFAVFKFDKWGHMTNSPVIRESNNDIEFSDEVNEISDDIEDILLELSDNGILTNCDFVEGKVKSNGIWQPDWFFMITIEKSLNSDDNSVETTNSLFTWLTFNEVYDTLQRISDYLESTNWRKISVNVNGENQGSLKDFLTKNSDYQFYGLTLYVSRYFI